MRPHEPTARSTKASGLARARMLMKSKLGWLGGYPSEQGWIVVPDDERPVEPLALDRDHLRRATYTANKLRGEFPRALPKLVGDVDAWHAAVTRVLETLKPWVHHGQPPPAELFETEIHTRTARARARALRQQHPTLHGLVDAVSWVLATRADAAGKALAWIEREAAALEVAHAHMDPAVVRTLSLQLMHLALALGPKPLEPLVRLLGAPAAHEVPTDGGDEYGKAAQAAVERPGKPLPPEPRIDMAAALDFAVRWLSAHDAAAAKRWLALLRRCELAPLLDEWAQWWPPMRKLVARGHALCNDAHPESPERKPRLTAARRELSAHRSRMPAELSLLGFFYEVASLSEADAEPVHPVVCRALGRLADPALARLRVCLVQEWNGLHASPDPWWNKRRLPLLLRAFDEHLRARPVTQARLSPWWPDAQGHGFALDRRLLHDELEVADIGRFFEVLRWLETHEPGIALDRDVTQQIVHLLEAMHDASIAARLVTDLHRAGYHDRLLAPITLGAAWRVCALEPKGYAQVIRALKHIEDETGLSPAALVDAMSPARGPDLLPLLRELLADDDLGPLMRCGHKLAVVHALGRPLPAAAWTIASEREWIATYPAALHDDLVWLCEQTPQAEAIAAKILRTIRHDTADIDQERRAIEAMLPSATPERAQALQTRLATLARRRAAPAPAPSPVKLERLRAKLRRRGALARLEALEAAADAVLPAAVGKELGLPSAPPWALEDRLLSLLAPLRGLDAPIRRLARTVLQARAGAPPWDLREHPANAAFLAMLRERGIDPAPWLDGIGTIETGHGEARMRLALEDDPLEVFHMGRHFGTCLSPGQCNFFSVFANAADVNKRVLYARDARGKVLGRRLFCLTQEGALLAFNPYCHDAATGFPAASTDFARRLAEAMGTVVVGRGLVPRLLAPDWYDDGPVDIAGQFDALEDGSSFRQALATIAPAGLSSLLTKTFGRPKLDEVLAPMVLALPELAGRPELARTLAAVVRHPERLPLASCRRLAALLVDAGAAAEAGALLAEPMVTALWQQHRDHRWMAFEELEVLARLAPSRALDLLRRTRDRGVRSWDAEPQADRLLAAGLAMEALHRPAQAIRLYRRAHEAFGWEHYRHLARERLAALDRAATAPAAASPA